MAVAAPPLQQEWEEWKRIMEETRRRTLSERLSRWTNLEVHEEEDDGGGKRRTVRKRRKMKQVGQGRKRKGASRREKERIR